MSLRLQPVVPPYSDAVERLLAKLMPPDSGYEPLLLFRVLAIHADLASRAHPMASGLLNKGLLPARDRELVISRTTARAGAEYEWGVHAVFFGAAVGLDQELLDAVATAPAAEGAFEEADRVLMTAVDELHDVATLTDETWAALRSRYDEAQVVELILLSGWYRSLATLTNAAAIPLEPWAARFPPPGLDCDLHLAAGSSLVPDAADDPVDQ